VDEQVIIELKATGKPLWPPNNFGRPKVEIHRPAGQA
jgi:hypothetical protein